MYCLIFTEKDKHSKNYQLLYGMTYEFQDPFKKFPMKFIYQAHLTAYWDGYTLHIDKVFSPDFLRNILFHTVVNVIDWTSPGSPKLTSQTKFTPEFIYENWFRLSI